MYHFASWCVPPGTPSPLKCLEPPRKLFKIFFPKNNVTRRIKLKFFKINPEIYVSEYKSPPPVAQLDDYGQTKNHGDVKEKWTNALQKCMYEV